MKLQGAISKIILVLLAITVGMGFYVGQTETQKRRTIKQEKLAHQAEVKAKFASTIITNDEATLYRYVNSDFQPAGKVAKDTFLELNESKNLGETDYFSLKNIEGYYLNYQEVSIPDENTVKPFVDQRYKSLIPFNQNVITDNKTNLYDFDGNIYVSLDRGQEFKLIVNADDKYGVDYLDHLLWINKSEANLVAADNSSAPIAREVRTLCYHKLYDENVNYCGSVICHELGQMRSHFDYLKNNGYYFMSMQDMAWWLKGQIQIPYNSVCLTFDDGGDNTVLLVALLNEYQIHATLFLIGSIYYEGMNSNYLELQSHTYDLHHAKECSIGRGSALVCRGDDEVIADLTKSKELTNAIAFCYPYFQYTSHLKSLVQQVGFQLAFGGNIGLIDQGDDPYTLSRYECSSSTSVDEMAHQLHEDY